LKDISAVSNASNFQRRIVKALSNPIQVKHAWTSDTHDSDMKPPVGTEPRIPPVFFDAGLLVGHQGGYAWDRQAGSGQGRQKIEKSATVHG
jgi:hypothetical protein